VPNGQYWFHTYSREDFKHLAKEKTDVIFRSTSKGALFLRNYPFRSLACLLLFRVVYFSMLNFQFNLILSWSFALFSSCRRRGGYLFPRQVALWRFSHQWRVFGSQVTLLFHATDSSCEVLISSENICENIIVSIVFQASVGRLDVTIECEVVKSEWNMAIIFWQEIFNAVQPIGEYCVMFLCVHHCAFE
jgi:hypothetical protein